MNSFKTNSAVKLSNRYSNTMFQAETPKEEAKRKIIAACRRDAGKYISFTDENIVGLLVGAVMKDNWPHFVLIDKDRKPAYVRSDSVFKIVKEIPANLSILDYLLNNQEDFIYDVAEDAVKNSDYEALTKVTVRYENERNERNNNQHKKQTSKNHNKK